MELFREDGCMTDAGFRAENSSLRYFMVRPESMMSSTITT